MIKYIFVLLLAVIFISGESYCQTATAPSGSGNSSSDPYLITSLNNLYWIANQVNTNVTTFSRKYLKQTADIDASSTSSWFSNTGWTPIGINLSSSFQGTYDGNGKFVSGLKINTSSLTYVGLFGYISSGGVVKNLGVMNANITGGYVTGALTGTLNGVTSSIMNCWSSGTAMGESFTGGLIGLLYYSTISACCSEVSVKSNYNDGVGGLVGMIDINGTINDSYASGSVDAASPAGGFCGNVGSQNGTFRRCYSTGSVLKDGCQGFIGGTSGYATITSCFWDIQTSGRSTSAAGEVGKTTTEMKTLATYSGWNFSSVWSIDAGINGGYPYLQGTPISALPVELTSFTAEIAEKRVELKWKTATETNNYGFEIERTTTTEQAIDASTPSPKNGSVAQHDWVRIGFVEGNGTTNAPKSYSFTDKSANGKTSYRLKQIDRDGKFEYSQTVEMMVVNTPKLFVLEQNYPNPFNPTTAISYQLSASGLTTLKVYDAIGREVATLVNEVKDAGYYSAQFDGARLSSGVYFAKLTSSGKTQMRKLVLMR